MWDIWEMLSRTDTACHTCWPMYKSATSTNVSGTAPSRVRVMDDSRIIANTTPLAPSSMTRGKKMKLISPVSSAAASITRIRSSEPYFSSSIGPRISMYIRLPSRWPQSAWPNTWHTILSQVSGLARLLR